MPKHDYCKFKLLKKNFFNYKNKCKSQIWRPQKGEVDGIRKNKVDTIFMDEFIKTDKNFPKLTKFMHV